jgi:hypothetical protein
MAVTDPYLQRVAWLTLGDGTAPLYLDDWVAGYVCTELDLGWPEVRTVVNNRPDQHGTDDRTKLWGARVITAKLEAWPGGTLTVDQVAELFGPYLDPGSRPQLHYLTSANDERILTLRPNAFSAPMGTSVVRKFQLSWVAPDPLVYAGALRSGTTIPTIPGLAGRTYDLTFNRTYPAGGQSSQPVTVTNNGDQAAWPTITIWGPVTTPSVTIDYWGDPGGTTNLGKLLVPFVTGYRIDLPHYVVIDTRARAAWLDGDPLQSVVSSIDQTNALWLPIPPVGANHAFGSFSMTGTSMQASRTHADVAWREAFLL